MSNRLVVAAGLAAGALLGFIGVNLVFWPQGAFAQSVVGLVMLQARSPGTQQTGHINVSGTVIGGQFKGGGAGLTGLDAGNVSSGTLADGRLTSNVDLLDTAQSFSGVKTFSTAPSFTASTPFSVSHTGIVSNLDADFLDGYHAAAFARLGADQTFTGTNTFSSPPSFTAATPFSVGRATLISKLNADELDGKHAVDFLSSALPLNLSGASSSALLGVTNTQTGGLGIDAEVPGFGAVLGGGTYADVQSAVLAKTATGLSGSTAAITAIQGNGWSFAPTGSTGIYCASENRAMYACGGTTGIFGYGGQSGVIGDAASQDGVGVWAYNEFMNPAVELAGPNGTAYLEEGNLFRNYAGTTRAAAIPVAYGVVSTNATAESGSGSFTVSWDSTLSCYVITIQNENYNYLGYTTTVTPQGVEFACTDSLSGSLLVFLRNMQGQPVRDWFDFTVFTAAPGGAQKIPNHGYATDKEWAKHEPAATKAFFSQGHPYGYPRVNVTRPSNSRSRSTLRP